MSFFDVVRGEERMVRKSEDTDVPEWFAKGLDAVATPKQPKPAMANLHAAKMHLAAAKVTAAKKKPVAYSNPLKLSFFEELQLQKAQAISHAYHKQCMAATMHAERGNKMKAAMHHLKAAKLAPHKGAAKRHQAIAKRYHAN